MEMSHHRLASEVVRFEERIRGTMKPNDPFLPKKKRMSPKLHIIGQKISPMIYSKGKALKE